jgi:hypothetical protein
MKKKFQKLLVEDNTDDSLIIDEKVHQTNDKIENVPWWISRPYSLILKESFLSSQCGSGAF